MESIRSVVNSLTGGGPHEKEGEVAANTAPPAQDVDTSDRDADEIPSNQESLREPKNLVTDQGDNETNSRPTTDNGVPPSDGEGTKDPAVVEEKSKSLSGSAVDGSHSAVFGLTPDGHKHDDTSRGHGSLKPAQSTSVSNTEGSKNESKDE